jgi:hypothetical protein
MMSRVDRYVDDDPGYLDWVARHPNGFVLNTGRTPAPSYLMLHHARCGTITGRPARGTTFTGDYTKVCGSRDELETFAQQLGGLPQPCGTCLGQHARPPGRTPASGKYGPLADYLAGSAGTRVRMTFPQIEELVGRLPDSAHQHRAWWGNNDANVAARAWLSAGWHVESVNQAAGEVVFGRGSANHGGRGRQPAGPRAPYIDAQVGTSMVARAQGMGLDCGKLAKLVAELNDNYSRDNAYAAHALLRALLDHIPPLLGYQDFKVAANSYPWGRTDKSYARRLADFKYQADDALHRQISRRPDPLDLTDMPPKIWINAILQECADPQHPGPR